MASTNRQREWYARNIDTERERGRLKYRKNVGTPQGCADNLLRAAKRRASEKHLPFDLTHEWVLTRIEAGRCEVTGLPFSLVGTGAFRFDAATLDRQIPELGYTQANCKVVLWGYNAAKGCGSHADVLRMAAALLEVTHVN